VSILEEKLMVDGFEGALGERLRVMERRGMVMDVVCVEVESA
jgi:hypothetical protein